MKSFAINAALRLGLTLREIKHLDRARSRVLGWLPDTIIVSVPPSAKVAQILSAFNLEPSVLDNRLVDVGTGKMKLGRFLRKKGLSEEDLSVVLSEKCSVEVHLLKKTDDILNMSSKETCNYTSCHAPGESYFKFTVAKAKDPRFFLAVVYGNNGKISWRSLGICSGVNSATMCGRVYGDKSVSLSPQVVASALLGREACKKQTPQMSRHSYLDVVDYFGDKVADSEQTNEVQVTGNQRRALLITRGAGHYRLRIAPEDRKNKRVILRVYEGGLVAVRLASEVMRANRVMFFRQGQFMPENLLRLGCKYITPEVNRILREAAAERSYICVDKVVAGIINGEISV